jgi:hypothetical protein
MLCLQAGKYGERKVLAIGLAFVVVSQLLGIPFAGKTMKFVALVDAGRMRVGWWCSSERLTIVCPAQQVQRILLRPLV